MQKLTKGSGSKNCINGISKQIETCTGTKKYSPSTKFKSIPRCSNWYLDHTDDVFTNINIHDKLQHLVKQEINHPSYPCINHPFKTNAVLGATTGNMIGCKN